MQLIGRVQLKLKIMEINFSQEQIAYINSAINENVYLEACPGSGKTEVVAAKAVKEMAQWDSFPSGMAILSFTNSATDELRERIDKHRKQSTSFYPHFVGTFDSFILKYIVSPIAHEITGYAGDNGDFSIRIVKSGSPIHIQTKYGIAQKGKQRANQYDYDLCAEKYLFNTGIRANDKFLNSTVLEAWQIKCLDETKESFLAKGFATYRDIEHLTIKLLENTDTKEYIELVVKKYPLIIIDECQDLSHEQLSILELLSNLGVNLHFIGDLNQAIYGFRNASPQMVSDFIGKLEMKKLELTINRRSGQDIVNICGLLIPSTEIVGQENYKDNNCLILEYEKSPKEVIPTFIQLTEGHENNVIIARGYSTLNKLLNQATKLNLVESLALAVVMFDEKNMLNIEQSLKLFSEYIRENINESVKPNSFNCPNCIDSSFMWRRFLFLAINHLVEKGLSDTSMNWRDWCKSAKSVLQAMPNEDFVEKEISKIIIKLKDVNHRAPNGRGEKNICETLRFVHDQVEEPIRSTTIHNVKGETHDVTMLISSSRSGKESHWKDWFKDPTNEAARHAYVACSRPKHLLILVIKKVNKKDRKELEDKGFCFENLV